MYGQCAKDVLKYKRHVTALTYFYIFYKLKGNPFPVDFIYLQNRLHVSRFVIHHLMHILQNNGYIEFLLQKIGGCRYPAKSISITMLPKAIDAMEKIFAEMKEYKEMKEKLWEEITDFYLNE